MKKIRYTNQDTSKLSSVNTVLGIITRTSQPFYKRSKYILITNTPSLDCMGYKACIGLGTSNNPLLPIFINIEESELNSLVDGDIIRLGKNSLRTVWSLTTNDNALMLTESCNCKCVMCPQPYREHDPQQSKECHEILDLLKGQSVGSICITGGEPSLLKKDFLNILKRCTQEHPESDISILTNGKTFSDIGYAKQTAQVSNRKTIFCVSLHSDVDNIHDATAGGKNSHSATENGIYNLAQFGLNVEIRHVITKYNYKRLGDFAEYLYSYFPFCRHYAFMGMELYGYAAKNEEEIYISPYEYREELRHAITKLYHRGLPVSIYNIPFCLCHKDIHDFARQSISQWKNTFLETCTICEEKPNCAGFFATSKSLPVEYIQPLTEKRSK